MIVTLAQNYDIAIIVPRQEIEANLPGGVQTYVYISIIIVFNFVLAPAQTLGILTLILSTVACVILFGGLRGSQRYSSWRLSQENLPACVECNTHRHHYVQIGVHFYPVVYCFGR